MKARVAMGPLPAPDDNEVWDRDKHDARWAPKPHHRTRAFSLPPLPPRELDPRTHLDVVIPTIARRVLPSYRRDPEKVLAAQPPPPTNDAFWQYVDRRGGPAACWPSFTHHKGQPRIWNWQGEGENHTTSIPLLVWNACRGDEPLRDNGPFRLCGIALCCNPRHLSAFQCSEVATIERRWAALLAVKEIEAELKANASHMPSREVHHKMLALKEARRILAASKRYYNAEKEHAYRAEREALVRKILAAKL